MSTRADRRHPVLVSVIVPSYNYGHYIQAAVESIWQQSHRGIEIIIVDDGSTDETEDVVRRLRGESPFDLTYVAGRHGGVAAAVNLGFKQSRGDLISILHADDVLAPNKIELQVQAMARNPQAVACHTEYVSIGPSGERLDYGSSLDLPPAKGPSLQGLLELRVDVRSMTLMARRNALDIVMPLDETLPVEDWQLALRLARIGVFEHVDAALVLRRIHGYNHSYTENRKSTFSFSEIAEDELRAAVPDQQRLDRILVIHSSTVIRNSLSRGNWPKSRDAIMQCWARFPGQRSTLILRSIPGLVSFAWLRFVRPRTPRWLLPWLLSSKSGFLAWRRRVRGEVR